jgi:hypothetical protein
MCVREVIGIGSLTFKPFQAYVIENDKLKTMVSVIHYKVQVHPNVQLEAIPIP